MPSTISDRFKLGKQVALCRPRSMHHMYVSSGHDATILGFFQSRSQLDKSLLSYFWLRRDLNRVVICQTNSMK